MSSCPRSTLLDKAYLAVFVTIAIGAVVCAFSSILWTKATAMYTKKKDDV